MDISVIRGDCCDVLVSGSAESRDSGLSLDEEEDEDNSGNGEDGDSESTINGGGEEIGVVWGVWNVGYNVPNNVD